MSVGLMRYSGRLGCRTTRTLVAMACVGVAALCLVTPVTTYGVPACDNFAASACSSHPIAHTARKHKRSKRKRRRAHARHHPPKHKRHSTQSPNPQWITLPGNVIAYNEDAILTEDGYVHGDSGGGPIYHLVGTRHGSPITIDARVGVHPSTTVEGSQSLLTPPLPGHPRGLAVLTMRVTTPAIGIEPARSSAYYSLFDAATGAHILTSGPFEEGPLFDEPVAVVDESLRFVGCGSYVTIAPSGAVSKTLLPGSKSLEPEDCTPRAVSAVVNEQVLIYSEVEGCPTVYVTNVVSEGTISHSPCLSANTIHEVPTPAPMPAARSGSDDWFFNGAAYAATDEQRFFSAATGVPLEPESTFALEDSGVLGGVRSNVVLIDGGDSYFVSTSSWLPVFTASSAQSFQAFGIADDDAWVEGAAGRVVISALTGAPLATGWSVFPEAGGTGWTLVGESTGACCSSEYLLRGTGTMLASLRTAP